MLQTRPIALLLTAVLLPACGSTTPEPTPAAPTVPSAESRKYLLEQIDDAGVIQLYADGFAALPLREKTLIYHLSQAAIAGRNIFYDQKHRNALEMKSVLEAIVSRPQAVDAAALAEIHRYTKLFWINNGPYNNLTARKFVLKTTPEALAAAARSAVAGGRDGRRRRPASRSTPCWPGCSRCSSIRASTRSSPTRRPGAGKDILTASANNLYSGVSLADLKGFTEKYGLNSRLVKTRGRLVEEVYKIDGRYGTEIAEVVRHIEAAIPFATESMATALRALVQWYRTGETADRIKYDIAWVQDKDSPVDFINGFIEVYMDARGIKGSWESVVFYINREKTERIRKFADNAQWFEDNMPYDASYRKPEVKGIIANAIDAVMETGDSGPVTPVGINLPNDQNIREQYGSKSVSLSNVNEAYDKGTPGGMRAEFSWTPEEAARADEVRRAGRRAAHRHA